MSMPFKVDENLPVELAELLSYLGHDAKTVNDQRLQGVNDRVLLERCDNEKRTLVTLDIDFSDIRASLGPNQLFTQSTSQPYPQTCNS